jgi:hypothetical protein
VTYEEKVEKLLGERQNALVARRGIDTAEVEATDEKNFNDLYLFGDGTNEGLLDIFSLWFSKLYDLHGRTTAYPVMHLNDKNRTAWEAQFALAVRPQGDSANGFYPPDGNNIGARDLNTGSAWFLNNGDGGQTTGGLINSAWASLASAIDSLQAKRLEDVLLDEPNPLYPGTDPETGDPYPEFITDGLPDYPDWFNNPHRANLLSTLTDVIDTLNSIKTHSTSVIRPIILKIEDGTNTLFSGIGMDTDLNFSTADLDAFVSALTSRVSTLTGYYDYFNGFSASNDISGQAGYVRATFDGNLVALENYKSTLDTTINVRVAEYNTALGNGSISSGLRKWAYFWIAQNINKPVSPYVTLGGLATARTDAEKKMLQTKETLDILFNDPTQYLPTPNILAVYHEDIYDDLKQLVERRVTVLWIGSPANNKYQLYKADISALSTLTGLSPVAYQWITTLNADSGMITSTYYDTPITPNASYVYQVRAYDSTEGTASPLDRLDSFNSSSNVMDNLETLPTGTITSGLVTFISDHLLEKGNLIYLSDGTNFDTFYVLAVVDNTSIQIEDRENYFTFTEAHKLKGAVRTRNY